MKIGVSVTRNGSALGAIGKYAQELGRRAERGLIAGAIELKDQSLPLVPRDTEALANSAYVGQEGSGLSTCVHVGYGMRDAPARILWSPAEHRFVVRVPYDYAKRQHDDEHLSHPNGGQANFLGEPIRTKTVEIARAFMTKFTEG